MYTVYTLKETLIILKATLIIVKKVLYNRDESFLTFVFATNILLNDIELYRYFIVTLYTIYTMYCFQTCLSINLISVL